MKFTTRITKAQGIFFIVCITILVIVFIMGIEKPPTKSKEVPELITESVYIIEELTSTEAQTIFEIETEVETHEPITTPIVTVEVQPEEESTEVATEEQTSEFVYYQIPKKYIKYGGDFPEAVQEYLWQLCEDTGINYYIVIALIERESGYKQHATGDSGNSKGYMQIYEKWHKNRMQAEGVDDLYNPYGNIRVGLSFLQEIRERLDTTDYHYILMSYNMGISRAKSYWKEGTHSTNYSRGIIQRAQEIEQELKDNTGV